MQIKKKSLVTVFSIAVCRQTGDKWQSKTLFLTIFDLCLLIVLTFSIVIKVHIANIFSKLNTIFWGENSVDSDQLASDDQGPHCASST